MFLDGKVSDVESWVATSEGKDFSRQFTFEVVAVLKLCYDYWFSLFGGFIFESQTDGVESRSEPFNIDKCSKLL